MEKSADEHSDGRGNFTDCGFLYLIGGFLFFKAALSGKEHFVLCFFDRIDDTGFLSDFPFISDCAAVSF